MGLVGTFILSLFFLLSSPIPVANSPQYYFSTSSQYTFNWTYDDIKPLPKEKMLPWFMIIGADFSGAKSLVNALKWEHPAICFARPAYSNWILNNQTRHSVPTVYQNCKWTRYMGEYSPLYMSYETPTLANLIKTKYPKLKIIIMLRNPTDRFVSQWRRETCLGYPTSEFFEIYSEKNKPKRKTGRYLERLKPWLKHFPPHQMMIIKSEDFFTKPAVVLNQVQKFLKLPEIKFDEDLERPPSKESLLCRKLVPDPKEMHPIYRENMIRFFAPQVDLLEKTINRSLDWH
jgi:hypothetical protein